MFPYLFVHCLQTKLYILLSGQGYSICRCGNKFTNNCLILREFRIPGHHFKQHIFFLLLLGSLWTLDILQICFVSDNNRLLTTKFHNHSYPTAENQNSTKLLSHSLQRIGRLILPSLKSMSNDYAIYISLN